jgi:hypothetical protein
LDRLEKKALPRAYLNRAGTRRAPEIAFKVTLTEMSMITPRRRVCAVAVAALLSGCARDVPRSAIAAGRDQLLASLRSAGVYDPARRVNHAAHVCTLRVDGADFVVLDLQETVPGAVTPRGVNAILVLDTSLRAVQRLEYTTERPLFCLENHLFVWGDLRIDGVEPEGNELTFADGARSITLRHIDANDVPAPSGARGLQQ